MNHHLRFLASLVILLTAWSSKVQAQATPPRLYAVIFGFTVVDNSHVENFRMTKIVDLLATPSTKVSLNLPQGFIDQAKKEVEGLDFKPRKGVPQPVDTTIIFLHSPEESKLGGNPVSWHAFDGTRGSLLQTQWEGIRGQNTLFAKDFGNFGLSFNLYWISQKPAKTEERKTLIDAEIKHATTNLGGAEILSRKDTVLGDQSITDIVIKPPKMKTVSIRRRFICSAELMLSVTALFKDDVDNATREAFDKIFEGFQFR